uniref:Uncharacterized protein n=1 Tax=Quercus lobata TaxID=97700 RepID=A0A7N2L1K9_QUELO
MEAIVLYTTPAAGHLIPMVELGKLIHTHQPSLTIHILIAPVPYGASSTAPNIAAVSSTTPYITFHNHPTITLPPNTSNSSIESLIFEFINLNNPNVHQSLLSISKSYNIQAFIVDFFCSNALSIAAKLNIPGYHFSTSGAAALTYKLYLPTIQKNSTINFKDLNKTQILNVPGVPPFQSSDLPKILLNNKCFLEYSITLANSAGIIVNTFESLEPRAIQAIADGLCVPDNHTPPVYYIGPLSQQLKEIASGLENSGHRFLWVVRNPPSGDENHSLAVSTQPDPDLDSLLPEGFLGRTKERGQVVKSWAPQVAVLNHNSVGGFVSHCGWNSVLEAVCAGVSMVAWPLYAEQRFNRVVLVEDVKIALWMNESKDGFVSATEVEKRVRELMDSENNNSTVRERVIALKEGAKATVCEGGSSRVALIKLVESWKN